MKPNKWIAHENVREGNKLSLLCFIFDGGSASYFASWKYSLNEDIDLIPILYPVREKRINEPMYKDMQTFADDLAVSLEEIFRGRYAFFGYCSGSVIAYETAVRAKELYGTEPEYGMIISSEAPEFLHESVPKITDENRERLFFEHLSALPFIDEKTLHDKVFLDYYKPLFTADHDLLDSYDFKEREKLNCDFDVIICPDDPKVIGEKALRWNLLTNGNTQIIERDGGHFLVDSQKDFIFSRLNKRLSSTNKKASLKSDNDTITELTDTEKAVIDIWEDIFGKTGFTNNDDFLLSGGDSLKAVKIINEIRRIYSIEITITDVFSFGKIKEFGRHIDELIKLKKDTKDEFTDEGEI
jgi:surfactin synthase thioesterase subunit/acyl carrier protein